jgi:hypothetical protein
VTIECDSEAGRKWMSGGAQSPRPTAAATTSSAARSSRPGASAACRLGSVALPPCATTHPLYTRFTNRFGISISETTTRPKPACKPAPARAALARAFVAAGVHGTYLPRARGSVRILPHYGKRLLSHRSTLQMDRGPSKLALPRQVLRRPEVQIGRRPGVRRTCPDPRALWCKVTE